MKKEKEERNGIKDMRKRIGEKEKEQIYEIRKMKKKMNK